MQLHACLALLEHIPMLLLKTIQLTHTAIGIHTCQTYIYHSELIQNGSEINIKWFLLKARQSH
jgi:hypothetical protein